MNCSEFREKYYLFIYNIYFFPLKKMNTLLEDLPFRVIILEICNWKNISNLVILNVVKGNEM